MDSYFVVGIIIVVYKGKTRSTFVTDYSIFAMLTNSDYCRELVDEQEAQEAEEPPAELESQVRDQKYILAFKNIFPKAHDPNFIFHHEIFPCV